MPPRETTRSVQAPRAAYGPLGDVRTPAERIPPCARCGKKATGAYIVGWEEEVSAGNPIIDAEFSCDVCGFGGFSIMVAALYPHYEVLRELGPGKLKLMRLTREQAEARVTK